MGFDVTFHPVSVSDLQRFVFDVADKGALAGARAREITKDARKQRDIADGVLARLPVFVKDVKADGGFANTVAFAAAAVAGYLHPYWYARGSALSFLAEKQPEVAKMITPLPKVAKGAVSKLADDSSGLLAGNYTASGVVLPENIPRLHALLRMLATPAKGKKKAALFDVFDEHGVDSLLRAIAYAAEHQLGLMEATDLVVPISNEGFTDADNMRAHFLQNEGYAQKGPPPAKKAASPKKAPAKKAPAKKAAPTSAAKPKKKAVSKAKGKTRAR
jgi:hypothetical protein